MVPFVGIGDAQKCFESLPESWFEVYDPAFGFINCFPEFTPVMDQWYC
jgi:hypothetical protein